MKNTHRLLITCMLMLLPINAHGMVLPEEDEESNASHKLLSSGLPKNPQLRASFSNNPDDVYDLFPELLQVPIIAAGETCNPVFPQEESSEPVQKLETEVSRLKTLAPSLAPSQTKKRPLDESPISDAAITSSKPVTISELMAAINRRSQQEIIRYLSVPQVPINEKSEVEVADLLDKYSHGRIKKVTITPLHLAVYLGDRLIAQALLNHKADPNLPSDCGYTPLMTAAGNRDIPMAEILLKAGAYKDQATPLREKAIDIAKRKKLRLMPAFLMNYKG